MRFDRPETWPKHPELQHFTRLRLIYTDSKPPPAQREMTYKLWG
ncbi:hypothetical protein AB0D12_37550 [Streptomyces sp. NPDC048479]